MRARGDVWLAKVRQFEAPVPQPKANRPAPQPPVAARPRKLSVSDVVRLVRDPYAIYAKHCLKLYPLGPLVPQPDALLRGTASHLVLETFVKSSLNTPDALNVEVFLLNIDEVLEQTVPWPGAKVLWRARLERIAQWFIETEIERQSLATPVAFEDKAKGALELTDIGATVTARADRIDETADGSLIIYDYKTGKPPSEDQQKAFDKQLLIEAVMAEEGGFRALGPRAVRAAQYIGIGSSPSLVGAPLETETPQKVLSELKSLLAQYLQLDQGFTARRAYETERFGSDYDQLARFGEWDLSVEPKPERVG
jgi:RecB family exonuclease